MPEGLLPGRLGPDGRLLPPEGWDPERATQRVLAAQQEVIRRIEAREVYA